MKKYGTCDSKKPGITELRQRRVRDKYPRARLNAVYDAKGEFKAWRIVSGRMQKDGGDYRLKVDIVLSGLHPISDDDAWQDAAEKLGTL